MKSRLSTKFILLFTAVLTGIFAIMLTVIQVTASSYIRSYITETIYSYHEDVDESVTAVVNEVAYSYARMVKKENASALDNLGSNNSYGARLSALQELVSGGETGAYFADVGWRDESGYLSVNGYICPNEEAFAEAEKNRNTVVLGGYKNGCQTFVIHMKNDITATEGSFIFFMAETALSSSLSDFGTEVGYSYIIRSDGYVFSHEDKDYVGKLLYYENMYKLEGARFEGNFELDGEKKIIIVSPMQTLNGQYGFDFYLVSVMSYAYYYGDFRRLTFVLIAVTVLIFVSGVVVAVVRARKLSRPVADLNSNIRATISTGKRGNLTAHEGDELYELEKKYDEMIERIFSLMDKSREDAETQRKLELDTLQMQINPHFLYNTLDAISWMAKIRKQAEIEELAVNLASFFRLSLHKGDKFITVGEEIELTAHYFEIDRIRFPDKVTVSYETDESILNYKTLKLILQPVVENALKYAFSEKAGKLVVRTYMQGNAIVYEVEDDGAGFDIPDDLLCKKNKPSLGGFGLYNVNERIKLEYGEGYGLTVYSEKGKGTKVVIRIEKRI